MAKLTEAQMDSLRHVASYREGCPIRLAHRAYAPMRRLVKRQLIEKAARPPVGDFHYWRITDAGRRALEEGK